MSFKKDIAGARCSAMALALGAVSAPTSGLLAQETGDPIASDSQEERVILVTGSRIPRFDSVAASPVMTLERKEIERFAEVNLEEFLNEFPQFVPDNSRSTNNPGDGTASLNLRGLGPDRSLVLFNGRRLAPQGTGSAIDINAIPAILIKQIDVVTGGASAVYGSDAVTGAVNFITRKVDGIEATGQFDIYGAGDGESYAASLVAGTGFAGDRGHITAFADYLRRTPLLGSDREFTEFVIGENSRTGELEPGGSSIIPDGIILFPPALIDGSFTNAVFTPDGSVRGFVPEDRFNFASDNYLQTPLERWSGGAIADFKVSDSATLFTELMFTDTRSDRQLAPTVAAFPVAFSLDPAFFSDQGLAVLGANFDPDGDGVVEAVLGKRLSEVGPRFSSREAQYYRALAGARVKLGADWEAEAHYSFGRVDEATAFQNDASRSRYQQGLLINPTTGGCLDPSGGCVPVNAFGPGNFSQEAIDFIRIDAFSSESQSTQHIASVVATGPLARWQAGEIFVSGGAEYRRNSASFTPSPILATGDTIAFGEAGQSVDGSFDVFELFAETSIPLLTDHALAERLELEGAVRYSDYSLAGGEWTWKLGGQWVPVSGLRVRGSWQRAVRAPNIGELLESPSGGTFQVNGTLDFCLAINDPVGTGLSDVCIAQGIAPDQLGVYDVPSGLDPSRFQIPVNRVRSGNVDLDPESADTWTIAADYQWSGPVSGAVGVSYYSIELDDAISADINPFGICAVVKDPDAPVCQVIEREASGFITNVADKPLNIASARAEGIDFNFNLSAEAPGWLNPDWAGGDARISLRTLATRTLTFGLQSTPAAPFIDCAGQFARDCSLASGSTFPDFTANTSLAYDTKSVGLALRWRYIGPQDNAEPVFDALVGRTRAPLAIPRVGDRHYLDLGVRVNATRNIELRAGIDNLLKTSPPLLGRQARQSNTDPSRYDIFGRRFFVSLRARLGN